jgi:hypothetical protein
MLKKPFFKANQAQSPVPQIEIKAGSNNYKWSCNVTN